MKNSRKQEKHSKSKTLKKRRRMSFEMTFFKKLFGGGYRIKLDLYFNEKKILSYKNNSSSNAFKDLLMSK